MRFRGNPGPEPNGDPGNSIGMLGNRDKGLGRERETRRRTHSEPWPETEGKIGQGWAFFRIFGACLLARKVRVWERQGEGNKFGGKQT